MGSRQCALDLAGFHGPCIVLTRRCTRTTCRQAAANHRWFPGGSVFKDGTVRAEHVSNIGNTYGDRQFRCTPTKLNSYLMRDCLSTTPCRDAVCALNILVVGAWAFLLVGVLCTLSCQWQWPLPLASVQSLCCLRRGENVLRLVLEQKNMRVGWQGGTHTYTHMRMRAHTHSSHTIQESVAATSWLPSLQGSECQVRQPQCWLPPDGVALTHSCTYPFLTASMSQVCPFAPAVSDKLADLISDESAD